MNVNFGLFPELEGARRGRRGKADRKKAYAVRALTDLDAWLEVREPAAAE
jgi:folate-dependent tRNA-U54 methylase TrmFO/GidA